jgi:hypothetical protein
MAAGPTTVAKGKIGDPWGGATRPSLLFVQNLRERTVLSTNVSLA